VLSAESFGRALGNGGWRLRVPGGEEESIKEIGKSGKNNKLAADDLENKLGFRLSPNARNRDQYATMGPAHKHP
jgi:hypothetical protein